jgi:hypothetical protein
LQHFAGTGQLFVRRDHLAQAYEGTHDRHIHVGRLLAAQHRREHGHALLGEDTRRVSTPAASGV